jgi:hypothetical protein
MGISGREPGTLRGAHVRGGPRARVAPQRRARPARAWRRGVRGLLLGLLALGLLLAQGSWLLHALLVRHTLCEHGELVHDDGARATLDDAAHAALEGGAREARLTAGDAPAGDDDEHAHCDLRSLVHRGGEVGPSVAPASLLRFAPPAPGGGARAFQAIALLDLAPKSSPPRA